MKLAQRLADEIMDLCLQEPMDESIIRNAIAQKLAPHLAGAPTTSSDATIGAMAKKEMIDDGEVPASILSAAADACIMEAKIQAMAKEIVTEVELNMKGMREKPSRVYPLGYIEKCVTAIVRKRFKGEKLGSI
jgi:S-adenosylmethionine synthetase